jgi:hypothetical protein
MPIRFFGLLDEEDRFVMMRPGELSFAKLLSRRRIADLALRIRNSKDQLPSIQSSNSKDDIWSHGDLSIQYRVRQ